ncbi:MAG TPA: NAD(P)-binding domain-containing protein, partial [Actinomycetales bacterium]
MTTDVDTEVIDTQVVVIGAGQAGLASAYFLARAGLQAGPGFVVLDANAGPGGAWQHRWPSLRLDLTNHVHDLPGLTFEPASQLLPAAEAVPAYFAAYEQRLGLDVRRPVQVRSVRVADDSRLVVSTDGGTWRARALVSATGTWTRPFWPTYPGQETFAGRQLHTVDYVAPDEFAGQHVVVVGGGISAVQLLGEISQVTSTTWVTRRPPTWRDEEFTPEHGRAAVALVEQRVAAGLLPESVVSVTGLPSQRSSGGWVREAQERGVLERLLMF